MIIKKRSFEITVHFVGWLIFLSLPILLSPEPPQELKNRFGNFFLLPLFLNSTLLIVLFYFNYFVLIPKFLFKNRYYIYILLSLFCIIITLFVSSRIVMSFYDKPPHAILMNSPIKRALPMVFNNSVLMFVVTFLSSIVLRLNNRWKLTEQKRLQSELSFLKSQINPHFLFNTLNNIYAETLGKANNAAEMILKLSDMMRYTITEVHNDKVPLQKELDYISNYIELQKLRLPSKVSLKYTIRGEAHQLELAPLLLIPFIENAFKHGVNPEQDSEINVHLEINNSELHLSVFNKKVETEKTIKETTGLGIENTRSRLNLIYPDKYSLIIEETENDYIVSLRINLI